jgi:hypothetical protein
MELNHGYHVVASHVDEFVNGDSLFLRSWRPVRRQYICFCLPWIIACAFAVLSLLQFLQSFSSQAQHDFARGYRTEFGKDETFPSNLITSDSLHIIVHLNFT